MVSNNLVTDSNKISTSSSNNSTNNNKALSGAKTQQQQDSIKTDQISKQETNFEDYDNEWDVGIGDLIIDLDADIEKSTQQNSQSSSSSNSGSSTTTTTSSLQSSLPSGGTLETKVTPNKNNISRNAIKSSKDSKDPLAIPKTLIAKSVTKLEQVNKQIAANIAGKDQKKISGGTGTVSAPAGATGASAATKTSKVSVNDSGSSGGITKIATTTTTSKHHHHSHHHKSSGGNSNSSSLSVGSNASLKSESLTSSSSSTSEKMSSASGSGASSKSAGKLTAATTVVDHQATLDKGLKMKIKRTKPGTKTSEAKHEIVKAEQNGAASGLDSDTNSSSGGSSSGKKQHNTLPVAAQLGVPVTPNTPTVSTPPQSNKRGSSGHRRDKQKDKKEKSDHSSTTTTTSSTNACSCASDGVNGVSNLTCSSTTCKNRTDSLGLRLTGNLGLNSSGPNNFAGGLITPNSGPGSIKDKVSNCLFSKSSTRD